MAKPGKQSSHFHMHMQGPKDAVSLLFGKDTAFVVEDVYKHPKCNSAVPTPVLVIATRFMAGGIKLVPNHTDVRRWQKAKDRMLAGSGGVGGAAQATTIPTDKFGRPLGWVPKGENEHMVRVHINPAAKRCDITVTFFYNLVPVDETPTASRVRGDTAGGACVMPHHPHPAAAAAAGAAPIDATTTTAPGQVGGEGSVRHASDEGDDAAVDRSAPRRMLTLTPDVLLGVIRTSPAIAEEFACMLPREDAIPPDDEDAPHTKQLRTQEGSAGAGGGGGASASAAHGGLPRDCTEDERRLLVLLAHWYNYTIPCYSYIAFDPGVRTFLTGWGWSYDNGAEAVKIGLSGADHLAYHQRMAEIHEAKGEAYDAARAREKQFNFIHDVHMRTINNVLSSYDIVVLPDFRVQKMAHGGFLHHSTKGDMYAWSHYTFRRRLVDAAAKWKDRRVFIGTEHYTTKTCTRCGELNDHVGGKDVFECPSCHFKCDRDIGASRTIWIRNLIIIALGIIRHGQKLSL